MSGAIHSSYDPKGKAVASFGLIGGLSPQAIYERLRLLDEVVANLHAVTVNASGTLFALSADPELSDALAAHRAGDEDAEDDGTAEPDGRGLPRTLDALFASVPREGHPVSPWSPSGTMAAEPIATTDEVARRWPDLVKR